MGGGCTRAVFPPSVGDGRSLLRVTPSASAVCTGVREIEIKGEEHIKLERNVVQCVHLVGGDCTPSGSAGAVYPLLVSNDCSV